MTQETYDALLGMLCLDQICCSCGRGFAFIFYGHYWRWLKTTDGRFRLKVQRVRCRYCGHSHAIHPSCLVPYSQLPADTQQKIILYDVGSNEIKEVQDATPEISECDIYHVKRRFNAFWRERLLSLGLSCSAPIELLIEHSIASFHRQFMQIRRGTNLKIALTNTG